MKLSAKLVIAVILLACVYPVKRVLDHFAWRRQSDWAFFQMKRCSNMGQLIYLFHERRGRYPKELHELVDSGTTSEARYRGLMFQTNPSASPQEWEWRAPETLFQVALFSGAPVTVWNCHVKSYVIGRPDGSATIFGEEKLALFTRQDLQPRGFTLRPAR